MERKIGETFEYKGKIYKVAEFDDCRNCAFIHINCSSLKSITGNCMYFLRNDGVNFFYHCVGGSWNFCIPYIGNESLLGTTKDAEK